MLRLILALFAVALITGCQNKEREEKNSLHLNLSEDPQTLDPRQVRTLRDITLTKQLYEGLYRLDEKGKLTQALAETTTLSDDLCTYTFSLKESVWSNGKKVTASDFERSWKSVLDPTFAADYAHMLFPIKNAKLAKLGQVPLEKVEIRALNEKTLVVTLDEPTPYFLELTAFPALFPYSQEENVSNGPFVLSSWENNDSLTLKKNRLYWDAEAVQLTTLFFTIVPDTTTESYLFEKNELDWVGQPLCQSIAQEMVGKEKHLSYPVAGTFWIKFNTQKAPFDDPRIRKAFAYAIDRQAIVKHVIKGHQKPALSLLPATMQVQDEPYFKDADIEKALTLFNEYTKENAFPKIILNYQSTSERTSKIVQVVQEQWQKVFGIHIELEGMERQAYQRKTKSGDYMVGSGDWIADFNDPLAFFDIFKQTSGMNDTFWQSKEFSALIDASSKERDPEKRKTLLQQAEALFLDEMPVAPLYHYCFDYIQHEGVERVALSPLGTADFKRARKSSPN